VLEALACEAPLLLSDIPAFREMAAGHASLVRGDGPEDWAQAMHATLEAPPDPGPGRAWALSFDWERTATATAELLVAAHRAYASGARA
jgi:glycosyltransferase involved in cell wall biosynthesis